LRLFFYPPLIFLWKDPLKTLIVVISSLEVKVIKNPVAEGPISSSQKTLIQQEVTLFSIWRWLVRKKGQGELDEDRCLF
jgi:hypothetical protein